MLFRSDEEGDVVMEDAPPLPDDAPPAPGPPDAEGIPMNALDAEAIEDAEDLEGVLELMHLH